MDHAVSSSVTNTHRAKMQSGRLPVSADIRKALNVADDEEMIVRVDDGEIRAYPARLVVERAQKFFKKYGKGKSKSIVDDLIAERRREAKRELE